MRTIESLLKALAGLTLLQPSGARYAVRGASRFQQATSRNEIDSVALTFSNSRSKSSRAGNRILQNGGNGVSLSARRSFPECLEQKLSPEECSDYIEQKIDSAGGHEVGEVNVKIHTPRTPEQFADSYWMVEVPVNIRGHNACDRNDGAISYPFRWDDGISNEGLFVQDISCFGKDAGECCLRIREYGRTLTESGYDVNGQCLSCFVHQEALVPYANEETKNTDYLDFVVLIEDDTSSGSSLEVAAQCKRIQMTADEVDGHDAATAERIRAAIASLETFNRSRTCDGFEDLLRDLYNGATVIYPLSQKIGRFACSVCYGRSNDIFNLEDDEVTSMIDDMLKVLRHNSPPKRSSKENCVVVYTNAKGEVVKTPELGGGAGGAAHHLNGLVDTPPKIPISGSSCSPFESQSSCKAGEGCIQTKGFDPEYKCMKLCSHATSPSDPLYPCEDDEVCSYVVEAGYDVCEVPDCDDDPSLCDEETEFCYSVYSRDQKFRDFSLCRELQCSYGDDDDDYYPYHDSNVRRRECSEDEVCDYYETYMLDDNFLIRNVDYCRPKDCKEDPFICSDDELCVYRLSTDELNDYYGSSFGWSCVENFCLKPDSLDAPSCEGDEICDYVSEPFTDFFCRKPHCLEDPSICKEGETCELGDRMKEYRCRPIETCETDPSNVICPEGWYCGSSRYFWWDSECRRNSCNEDPTLCKSNESCKFVGIRRSAYLPYSDGDSILQGYQCRPDCSKCEDGQSCTKAFSLEYDDVVDQCVPDCLEDPSMCNEDEFCSYDAFPDPGICRNNTCVQDPSICDENQFCDERSIFLGLGVCRQNTCRQDSSLCGEGTRCSNPYPYFGSCVPNTCLEDPSICNEDEYCNLGGNEDGDDDDDDYFFGQHDDYYYQYNKYDEDEDDYIAYNSAATCKVKTCVQEPSICNDNQFCFVPRVDGQEGECLDNTCMQDETLCNEKEQCIIPSTSTNDEIGVCTPRSCNKEPGLCDLNEYCRATDEYHDFGNYYGRLYKCVEYSAIGDACRGTGGGRDCNPAEAVCLFLQHCIYEDTNIGDDDFYTGLFGTCVAYGEGSCTDESGNLTQTNCKSNEYCPRGSSRCLPKPSLGDCCDRARKPCGNTDEGNELVCVPQLPETSIYVRSTCRVSCEVDSDCTEPNEFCGTSGLGSLLGGNTTYCRPY